MAPIQPWYLSTFAVAEQLYDALIVWDKQQEIEVTTTSLAFFRQFIPNLATGTYAASTSAYSTLTASIRDFADGFVLVNSQYTPSDGGLAEQYTRYSGSPLSARDLTWSYASALTVFAARGGYTPPPWGAAGLVVPSVCSSNPGPTASVTFDVQATTNFGGEKVNSSVDVPELNLLPICNKQRASSSSVQPRNSVTGHRTKRSPSLLINTQSGAVSTRTGYFFVAFTDGT